ncbi:flavin reductase family protein [Tropicimonas sp.]|uniref:flavin reductase family protein n=1 Tax=Tropicimonas sp. TaxID=2067044 RepID=UPI003A88145D
MFYRPEDGHGLPENPFNAIVTPRPIAWISTRGPDGSQNLAPYSFFNAVAYTPPQVMFATTGRKHDRDGTKDTLANIRNTGVFAVNVVEYAMREAMNLTSGTWDRDVDEAELAGIDRAECETIDCPRAAGAPATLECRLTQIVELPGPANQVAFGEVTGIHQRDDCLRNGRFDVTLYQPLTRLGYRDFARITEMFEMKRPGE